MKIYKFISFILWMIFFPIAYAYSPGLFVEECNSETNSCKINAYLLDGKKVVIDNDFPQFIRDKSWIKKINDDLWEVGVSCGSPCNYTYYVDLNTGKKSTAFFLVNWVDPKHLMVSYLDSNNKIAVSPIFQK